MCWPSLMVERISVINSFATGNTLMCSWKSEPAKYMHLVAYLENIISRVYCKLDAKDSELQEKP